MNERKVIWPEPILGKLHSFSSEHYTAEESYDHIVQFILETEDLLLNPVIGKTYTEEFGEFKGLTRIVVKRFRVYYKAIDDLIVIAAVCFPGEQ